VIIAQISDTHIDLDVADAGQRIADFERTIEDINALDPAPDLIIHSGDIVQNGKCDEYERAASILEKATAPTYVMVGNKDDRSNLRKTFTTAEYLTSDDEFVAYTIEGFAVRLVVLDTLNPGGNKGEFCDERFAALNKMIAENPNQPTAIFAHHPPIEVNEGPDPIHFETDDIRQRFCHALQQSESIIGVFCGHVHRGVAGLVGKIPVLVMTCTATPLRRGEYPPEMKDRPVYHLHKYDPEWGFTSELRIVGN